MRVVNFQFADTRSIRELAQDLNVHVSTPWRWILDGCRGHKLPSILIGSRRRVRVADLQAFLTAINADAGLTLAADVHQPESTDANVERALADAGL